MSRRSRTTTAIGFLAAVAVLWGLVSLFGTDRVVAAVSSADVPIVGVVVLFAFGWLLAWALALRTVLASVGVAVSVPKAVLLYASAAFSNNVTPFGQAGGEPVTALIVAREAAVRYETGGAAIASVDTANVVSSLTIGLLAGGLYVVTATGTLANGVFTTLAAVVVLAAGVAFGLVFSWRYRHRLREGLIVAAIGVVGHLGRLVPRFASIGEDAVADRVRRFGDRLASIAGDRQRLAVALAFSAAGWLCQIVALSMAFRALGHEIPFVVAAVAITASNVAGIAPLPGGLGSIEAAFVAVLTPMTAVPVPTVVAAVIIYRTVVYWLPVVFGGGATLALGVRATAERA